MRLSDVLLVAVKELRETLRDRRTLVVMVLFPLVVYPLVSLMMAQVMASHTARGDARRTRVALLGPAEAVAPVRARLAAEPKSYDVVPTPAGGVAPAVESGTLDAALEVVPSPAGSPTRLRVFWDEARDESRQAHDRLGATLGAVLAPGCGTLFALEDHGVAPRARVGGYVLSKLLPLIVVVMIMLGAFYPAIDITAGERERGTLETILSAPVSRFDLMTGKVLAVATLSAITGLLNMTSMSLTMIEGVRLIGASAPVAIPWTRAASTLIVVVPAAFLFASVMVAIGAMARSFKEAQTLLTPVYFLCFTPSLVAGLGDWELGGLVAIVPGVNVTLLARDLVLGKATVGLTLLVVASTLACGALALSLAARLYDSERLLAADEGTMKLGAWVRRLVGLDGHAAPSPTGAPPTEPGAAHALALFAIAFVLNLGVFAHLQMWRLIPGLAISQWVGLLGLVALYARGTGQRFRALIRLRPAPARAFAGAALVGVSAWIVVLALSHWFMPEMPKEVEETLRRLVAPMGGRMFVLTLALVAITPAVCEEVLFRGAILRGFAATLPPLTSAVLTGVLFGLFHANLYQLVPATILGIVLSLIALRSGSILPSMLTHFINNACIATLARLGLDKAEEQLSRPAQAAVFIGALAVLTIGAALLRSVTPREHSL
jgi:sodium transport system permease protein